MPDYEQIGVQAVVAGMAQFRSDAAAYTRNILDMTGVTKVSAAGIDALGQVAIGAEREIGRLAVSFVRIANQEIIRFVEGLVSAGAAGTGFVSATKTLQDHLEGIARVQLAPLFNELGDLVSKASPAIEAFTQFALGAFGNLANNAELWGANVVNQFAQGMWDAVGAVLQALTNIANLVTYFLAPGSPPRLLPKLDDWGKGAMQAYLEGWGKADFGIFNELSGTIESYLKSLSANANDTGLIPRILGAREAIAEAVDQARQTGKVTTDSLNQIYAAAGATTKSMQDYVKSVFNLELANAKVSQAQAALNKVTAEYDALLKPVNDKLGQVSESQKRLAEDSEISQLKLVALDPNATAAEKRQAQLEIERILTERQQRALVASKGAAVDAAQTKLDAAKKGAQAAQDQFDTQRALMALQTQQNELLKQQIQLLERLNKASGGGGGPKPGGGPSIAPKFTAGGFDLAKLIPPGIRKDLADLASAFETAWARILTYLQPAIDAINDHLIPAWNRLVAAIVKDVPIIEAIIADLVAFIVKRFSETAPAVIDEVAGMLDTLTTFWTNHGHTVLAILDFLGRTIVVTLSSALLLATTAVSVGLRSIEGLFDLISAIIQGNWALAWQVIVKTVSLNILDVLHTVQLVLSQIASIVDLDLAKIQATWAGDWELINIAVDTVLTKMSTAINAWLTATATSIVVWIAQQLGRWNGFWAAVGAAASGTIGAILGAVNTLFSSIEGLFNWLSSHVFNFHINLPTLPDWAIPGSPTPFEIGLRGIAAALADVNRVTAQTLNGPLSLAAPAVSSGGSSYTDARQFNLGGVNTQRQSDSIIQDFAIMQILAGAPA